MENLLMESSTMYNTTIKISIIIPCYNAENKMYKCISSLKNISFNENEMEVIFVDDCSTDSTVKYIKGVLRSHRNWHLIQLTTNSGSPSLPRNTGVKKSKGKYIFFLDIDDEILPDALNKLYAIVQEKNSDVVRSSLIVDDGSKQYVTNTIEKFETYKSKHEIIKIIFEKQSTTPPSLIKKELLIHNNIQWNQQIRMGEDTIFLADLLSKARIISYLDEPIYIYHKANSGEASSTQTYGKRELLNHLYVWTYVEKTLKHFGYSYYEIRGQVALQTVLQAFKNYYQWDIDRELFSEFSQFINNNWNIIKKFNFSSDLKEMLLCIKENDYDAFFEALKPKLLIAGYDLKFILPIVPKLKEHYAIKIDEWAGHNTHNEKQSRKLIAWADIIFCEWLLGNAVWYAEHKLQHQKLIVRMHRFELTTEWGHKIKKENVDTFMTVGLYTFEQMVKTFNIDRNKSRLVHNYIDTENYEKSDDPSKVFNLGIVGILPARKGYLNALKILKSLTDKDERYNLSVFGKMPEELSWIKKDKEEMDYYQQCEEYIKENQLETHIQIKGWVDTKVALKNIGFVLSVSETGNLPESFHIAPAEGFASGNQGVFLHWNGVEYLYPEKYIFDNVEIIADYIYVNSNIELFNKNRKIGETFVKKNYSTKRFIQLFHSIIKDDSKLVQSSVKKNIVSRKIFILGSCVYRDILNLPNDYELIKYCARTSFASIFSPKFGYTEYADRLKSPFQASMLKDDLLKRVQIFLEKEDFDILLIDFIDERYNLIKNDNNAICSKSNEFINTGILNEQKFTEEILSNSQEYMKLWEDGWKQFISLMKKRKKLHQVVLHKTYWSYETIQKTDFSPNISHRHIQNMNSFLDKLYLIAEKNLPKENIISFDTSIIVADEKHRWGKTPYHYSFDYYKTALQFLNNWSNHYDIVSK